MGPLKGSIRLHRATGSPVKGYVRIDGATLGYIWLFKGSYEALWALLGRLKRYEALKGYGGAFEWPYKPLQRLYRNSVYRHQSSIAPGG